MPVFVISATAVVVAQQMADPVRIGVLTAAWGEPASLSGLVDGLNEMGYREGDDYVVAVRFTAGDVSALPVAARDIVAGGVDILVPVGPLAAEAASQATQNHPIVFLGVGDPVGQGLIESFARPGGNITGVANLTFGIGRRRLELFKELIPQLRRVIAPYNIQNPHQALEARDYRRLAEQLDIVVVEQPLATIDEAIAVLSGLGQGAFDGILAPRDVDLNIPGLIIEATLNQGIPSMFDISLYVEAGGLASYGGSSEQAGRQVARMIDKLIRGASPEEIPAETNAQVEFVVNLGTANELGLTIPPVVVFQADRILR